MRGSGRGYHGNSREFRTPVQPSVIPDSETVWHCDYQQHTAWKQPAAVHEMESDYVQPNSNQRHNQLNFSGYNFSKLWALTHLNGGRLVSSALLPFSDVPMVRSYPSLNGHSVITAPKEHTHNSSVFSRAVGYLSILLSERKNHQFIVC